MQISEKNVEQIHSPTANVKEDEVAYNLSSYAWSTRQQEYCPIFAYTHNNIFHYLALFTKIKVSEFLMYKCAPISRQGEKGHL